MKFERTPFEPQSLRGRLLLRLVPALAVISAAGFLAAIWVANRTTEAAFDHATASNLLSLVTQVEVRADGRVVLDLPEPAEEILRTDPEDLEFFAVRGPKGELLGGDADLVPGDAPAGPPVMSTVTFRGRSVRKASFRLSTAAGPVTAAFAETMVKRQKARSDLLLASLLPSLCVLIVSVVAISVGVGRGLAPLDRLGADIRRRRVDDFSPVASETVPLEARPLVDAIDRLLEGLNSFAAAQRAFLADAAHQMRTPLTALATQVELLVDGLPREERTRAEKLQQSLKRLSRLVNQLLALARSGQDANIDRPAVPVDLAEIAEGIASEWYDHAAAKGVEISFDLAPAQVLGRGWLLQDLLTNLIDNAVRHAPTGGNVGVTTKRHDGRVLLEVSDDGPGVPPNEREAIFRRFYRGQGMRGEGSGLGLAIVAEIAGLHGAEVEVGGDAGAVFRVSFPDLDGTAAADRPASVVPA